MMDFSGRRVLIAGGAGNIGTGLAKELLGRGAKVIVTSRSQKRYDDMLKTIPTAMHSNLSVIVADVSTEEGATAIFDQSTNQEGGVQHVIASIGSWHQGCKLVENSLEDFNKTFSDRVVGHFLLLKAFSAYLEKQQGSTYTLLTGGGADTYMAPGISLVCVSTGALHGFSTAARFEFKDSNMAFCEFRIHCLVLPKPDDEIAASETRQMGHDLMAKAIVATMAARSRDRNDIYTRQSARDLAAK